MKYPITGLEWFLSKRLMTANAGEDVECCIHGWKEHKLAQPWRKSGPQKSSKQSCCVCSSPWLGIYPKEMIVACPRDTCTLCSLQPCSQLRSPNCLWADESMKQMWRLDSEEECTPVICGSMDGAGGHCVKWNKPGTKRHQELTLICGL